MTMMQEGKEELVLEMDSVFLNYAVRKTTSLKRAVLSRFKFSRVPKKISHSNTDREFALSNIDLKFYSGDAVGVVGLNGAGKSTLCKLLAGVLDPTTGSIDFHARVGTLLSLGSFFSNELSGHDNIYLAAALMGKSYREIREKYADIVEFSELGSAIDKPLETYSKGMTARLSFSIATSFPNDILIIDEALSVGDKNFKKKCLGRTKSLVNQSKLIIFVSHSQRDIKKMCNRAILLDKGEVIAEGEVEEVLAIYEELG
jgi:ABC-type polysaccharide/polyol phosphate transport system ATPase subunit